MAESYLYELWNGKKVVGYYCSSFRIVGRTLIVPTQSILKQSYKRKFEIIKVPMFSRILHDDGIDITFRYCLDVRRKSKRQIAILNTSKHMCAIGSVEAKNDNRES